MPRLLASCRDMPRSKPAMGANFLASKTDWRCSVKSRCDGKTFCISPLRELKAGVDENNSSMPRPPHLVTPFVVDFTTPMPEFPRTFPGSGYTADMDEKKKPRL